MKKNKNIKIIGKTYQIDYRPIRSDKASKITWGTTEYPSQKITLNTKGHREQISETLLHEILHIVNTALMIGLRETQICQLSSGMFQVLKDNKLKF